MLNKELVDPTAKLLGTMKLKIKNYEKQIEAFKKYDSERKKYYADICQKVGELESQVQEFEHNAGVEKLKLQNTELKKQVKALEAKLFLAKGDIDYSDSDLAIQTAKALQYKEVILAKNKQIKYLKEQISKLVSNKLKS